MAPRLKIKKKFEDFFEQGKHEKYLFQVLAKMNEMSYGLPNMSEMLKYADQEVADMAIERRQKRRAEFDANQETESKTRKVDQGYVSSFQDFFTRFPKNFHFSFLIFFRNTKPKTDQKPLPPPLRPSAKQIGLFLT